MKYKGKVKWFNKSEGFGFIEQDANRYIFVDYTAIEGKGSRTLREGEEVEFEVTKTKKGSYYVSQLG
jgi:CspA family cold shock protein